MFQRRPFLEKIEPSFGSSFALRKFDQSHANSKPFWHFHPEIEIVYIKDGSGRRHIGNHISQYVGGDLIVVGPNLPHYGFTDRFSDNQFEVIVQMRPDFLGTNLFSAVELQVVDRFFERSKSGLSFHGNTKTMIGERLESMFYMSNFEKLIELFKILYDLANSKEYDILNVDGYTIKADQPNIERLDDVFSLVRQKFTDVIALEEVAQVANMTSPAFCRFFKKNTGKTFIEFLNEYRITHACKLLAETSMPISEIAFDCGFNNFSNFNRSFRKLTDQSPSAYRNEVNLQVLRLE